MVYKTYISKYATIVSNSKINTGINPISELVYGKGNIVSRGLVYFDHSRLSEFIEDGTMVDTSKMTHTLHITNASSLDFTQIHQCEGSSINDNKKIRATSFDLIFFLIPKEWDRGKGFDYTKNYFNASFYSSSMVDKDRLISTDGCNWFNSRNGMPWDENGIYTNEHLSREYDKFSANEESIVIARQRFDIGNESISVDITDTVNKFISGELENHGIGIAFSPMTELTDSEYENYIGFLTDKTNTFFEPYLETRYDDVVSDDRSNFVLNKDNRLYLYCTIGDHLDDLDDCPTVTIVDGDDNVVLSPTKSTRQFRGIYYVDLKLSQTHFKGGTMLYDTWDGISYHSTNLDDVELNFTLNNASNFFNIGDSTSTTNITFSPSISGIQENEEIKRGDVRKLVIKSKPSYTNNTIQLMDSMEFRLYVKDGTREIDVIEWDKVNKSFTENYYMVDTNMLIPNKYHVDIRIRYGMNSIIHHDVLKFSIVDDLNNRYA